MNTAKVAPKQIETSFPQQKDNQDKNDANDSKVNLLESESPQENIAPANDHQPEISDAQRAENQAPAKSVSESQFIRQCHEVHNEPITETTSSLVENSRS